MTCLRQLSILVVACSFLAGGFGERHARGEDATTPPSGKTDPAKSDTAKPDTAKSDTAKADPAKADGKPVPLTKDGTILLDPKGKKLLLKTKVVLRDGVLEMLVCRKQTKEHEAILSINAPAFVIHSGLLALGAEPGSPVQFSPDFQPPKGQKIDIFLAWTDEKGKQNRVAAQEWIRNQIRRYYVVKMDALPADAKLPKEGELRYDEKHKELTWYGPMTAAQRDRMQTFSKDPAFRKAIASFYERSQPKKMAAHWVFAGSGFFMDEDGKKHYLAEGGDVICVANFPSAMLDVDEQSSSSGEENLLYEAWTEKIPPLGTEVTVELIPQPKQPPKE